MKRLNIIKNNSIIHSFEGETLQAIKEQPEYISRIEHGVFGKEAYSYQELISESVPEIKEVIDEVEIITQEYVPAVYQTIHVPAEYSVELVDITSEIEQAEILRQIEELEKQITPRRYREAILSGDHSFIESVNNQIQALREQL